MLVYGLILMALDCNQRALGTFAFYCKNNFTCSRTD